MYQTESRRFALVLCVQLIIVVSTTRPFWGNMSRDSILTPWQTATWLPWHSLTDTKLLGFSMDCSALHPWQRTFCVARHASWHLWFWGFARFVPLPCWAPGIILQQQCGMCIRRRTIALWYRQQRKSSTDTWICRSILPNMYMLIHSVASDGSPFSPPSVSHTLVHSTQVGQFALRRCSPPCCQHTKYTGHLKKHTNNSHSK